MSRQASPTLRIDEHLSSDSSCSSSSSQPGQWQWSAGDTIQYLLNPVSLSASDKWRNRLQLPHKMQPTKSLLTSPGSTEQLLYPLLLQLSADDLDIRNGAHDILVTLVDQHAADEDQLEQLLEAIIASGLNEWATVDSEVCFNTMQVLPTLLQRILVHCGRNISPKVMGHLVESLAKRLLQVTHQKQALHSLSRIKHVIGESLFDHFLETHYPRVKRDFDLLSDVYGESSDPTGDTGSEEEPEENEGVITKVYDEYGNEIARTPSRRVTFGGEVVKIRTPDSDATTTTTPVPSIEDPGEGVMVAEDAPSDPLPVVPALRVRAPPKSSRIPLPIRPALNEPRRRRRVFKPPAMYADRLWSSSDDVHLNVDVDVNVLLRNIGMNFDYLMNERDSSTTSSSEGYRHSAFDVSQKFGTNRQRVLDDAFQEEDWSERVTGQDESDHIPAKNERTKRAVSSDFSHYPPEKPDISFLHRPVSEDTLNVLPAPSRLPVRLKPKSNRLAMCRHHKEVAASLPSLQDVEANSTKRYLNYSQQPNQQNFRTSLRSSSDEINQTHLPLRSEGKNEAKLLEARNQPGISTSDEGLLDTATIENTADTGQREIPTDNELLIRPAKYDSILAERKPLQMKAECLAVNSNLERKPGVKLRRSLTKEIQIPRSSYNASTQDLGPFEHPRDAMQKILLQFSSNEWEIIIQALLGVIRLSKHHSKLLSPCLQPYAIAVSKEIKNLRSQVARAACSCAENIFRNVRNIVDQNIEELSNALFLRCTDTNKFLREDSNKALDAMIDNVKFSKSFSILTQKGANHVNALVRASTARLLLRLLRLLGASRILTLHKEKRELIFSTVIKLSSDGNLETRSHAKNIILFFADNGRVFNSFCETLPRTAIISVNKFLSSARKTT